MAPSPTAQNSEQSTLRQSPPRRLGVLVWLFRLLLLGVGGSLAWLTGVAIAQFYPAKVDEPPLLERAIRGTAALGSQIQRISNPLATPNPTPAPQTATPSTAAPDATTAPETPPSLTSDQRQQLETELSQLEAQLQALGDRTTQLEVQLGRSPDDAPLETRIQRIEQRLNPDASVTDATEPGTEPGTVPFAIAEAARDNALLITLPSDALFESDQVTLRPAAQTILDSITTDLQPYAGATIQVNAHTDTQSSVPRARTLSFEQAKSIQTYLQTQLGDSFQWVVVGYGQTRPVATETTPISRQRNRRIEIIIHPDL